MIHLIPSDEGLTLEISLQCPILLIFFINTVDKTSLSAAPYRGGEVCVP